MRKLTFVPGVRPRRSRCSLPGQPCPFRRRQPGTHENVSSSFRRHRRWRRPDGAGDPGHHRENRLMKQPMIVITRRATGAEGFLDVKEAKVIRTRSSSPVESFTTPLATNTRSTGAT